MILDTWGAWYKGRDQKDLLFCYILVFIFLFYTYLYSNSILFLNLQFVMFVVNIAGNRYKITLIHYGKVGVLKACYSC